MDGPAAFDVAIRAIGLPVAQVNAIKDRARWASTGFKTADWVLWALTNADNISAMWGHVSSRQMIKGALFALKWYRDSKKPSDKPFGDPAEEASKLALAAARSYEAIANDPPDAQYSSDVLLAPEAGRPVSGRWGLRQDGRFAQLCACR